LTVVGEVASDAGAAVAVGIGLLLVVVDSGGEVEGGAVAAEPQAAVSRRVMVAANMPR
jgi:hypothetical protein